MENWIVHMLEKFGYLGVFLMMTLENIFPPIPSEVVLTFGGYITTRTELSIWGVAASATGGSVLGAVILYRIGLLLGMEDLEKIIGRWGHILRIKIEDIYKADAWFKRYGYWTIFFFRMIPFIRSLISIPAGIANMKCGLFLLLTVTGTFVWNILLIWMGTIFDESWKDVLMWMDRYSNITYGILTLAAVVFIAGRIYRRRDEA